MHHRHPGIEALIAGAVDDVEPYRVYGDWLRDRGDPRGDLIHLQIAREGAPHDGHLARAEEVLLRRHAPSLIGPFARFMRHGADRLASGASGQAPLRWTRGFVAEATLAGRFPMAEPVAALLDSPAALVLQHLVIQERPSADTARLFAALAEGGPPPTLTLQWTWFAPPVSTASWESVLRRGTLGRLVLQVEPPADEGPWFPGLEALAAAPSLGQLDTLELYLSAGSGGSMVTWCDTWVPFADALAQIPRVVVHVRGDLTPGTRLSHVLPQLELRTGTLRPQYITLRNVLKPSIPVFCPHCETRLDWLRMDADRAICTACSRSFAYAPK